MSRHLISSHSPFESQIGYSRAVVSGPWVFVSGTTGYDYSTSQISPDVAQQCEQALKNIHAALQEGRRGDEGCGEGALSVARPEGFQKLLAGFAKVARRCEAGGYNVPSRVDGGGNED